MIDRGQELLGEHLGALVGESYTEHLLTGFDQPKLVETPSAVIE